MLRRALGALFFVWITLLTVAPCLAEAEASRPIIVELFSREGCPRCAEAKAFLEQLRRERPEIEVITRDVVKDASSRARLQDLAAARGVTAPGVPSFLVNGHLIVGFLSAETTGARLREALDHAADERTIEGAPGGTCSDDPAEHCETASPPGKGEEDDSMQVPLLGRVSARSMGMPLFTLVIGLLDGFNPCAMWVLLLLLSFLVSLQSRAKMLAVAGTFVLMSGVVYFAFMAAWLNVFLLIGLSRAVQVLLAAIAVFVGAVNVKDFFAFKKGVSLSIPEAAKPGLYRRMRAIVTAENLPAAVAGAAVMAGLVNFIELLCTAGFPAVYTRILTLQKLPSYAYYGYLVLYNIAYIADDTLMLAIAVITLSRRKLQEREGRWLKLVSGVVMLGLGVLLMAAPQLLVRG